MTTESVSNSASRRRADRTALLPAGRSTLNNLRALRDEGAGIALDDFCTGYASLRYLATLRMTSIKIDKSFTAGLPDHEISRRSFVP